MLSKAKIKYIQTLGHKKYRDEEGLFLAEGPKIISELLKDPAGNVLQVYATKVWIDENKQLLQQTDSIEITEPELEKISQLKTPHQALAIVKKMDPLDFPDLKGKILLALDAIQDPGNLGTIIRIADWFGIEWIVCGHECADAYNPKVIQATMGSIARVKLIYADLEEWLRDQKEIPVYATSLDGQDMQTLKKIKEGIFIIGNESRGIQAGLLQLADVKITIPRKGKAESLNAAVATGIVLSHIS